MITKLILDTQFGKAGTPVAFLGFEPEDGARVELPGGRCVVVDAAAVDAHEPEEALASLAEITGIPYGTLAKYAREGRILGRKSGGVWLSTQRAVEAANIAPRAWAGGERPECEWCGKMLPLSASPYWVGLGEEAYLCEECAEVGDAELE